MAYNGGVGSTQRTKIDERVARAAEAALRDHHYVSCIDVLIGMGWLQPVHRDEWRQGRCPYLEAVTRANLAKISKAMRSFRRWARQQGLQPSETAYVARSRDRRQLRFSKSGDLRIERAHRTHWVSSQLSERKRERLAERVSRQPDLVVISPLSDWACTSCGGTGQLLIMEDPGPLCLTCADLDHLVFLPSGDAALTRRAKKASRLSAAVVRFSRARKRYERQGLLVEELALEQAERACLADEEARVRRRGRDEARRLDADAQLGERITAEIRRLFPGCPPARAEAVAAHTGTRGSGRVGRTAAARELDPKAIELAVAASVRHVDTAYDDLLMAGVDRDGARAQVRPEVRRILAGWQQP